MASADPRDSIYCHDDDAEGEDDDDAGRAQSSDDDHDDDDGFKSRVLLDAFGGEESKGKCRFTTRGLHRVQPYEVPECIGGKLLPADADDGVDGGAADRRSSGCAERRISDGDTQILQRKEKWNRHNVGKDFNNIYQEAKWKG